MHVGWSSISRTSLIANGVLNSWTSETCFRPRDCTLSK